MNEFLKQGYIIVRQFVPNPEYYFKRIMKVRDKKSLWLYKKGDEQAPGSPNFYKLKLITKLQDLLLPKMEKLTSLKLFKTYNYMRIYQHNDTLTQHSDRDACEISVTINIGAEGTSIWPIYLADYEDNIIKVELNPGDGLLYMGCDLLHWRDKYPGKQIVQAFLHYVNQQGPNAAYKDDVRVNLPTISKDKYQAL